MGKIAVLGMGCLFPGYTDKTAFWDKIMGKQLLTTAESYQGRTIERGALTSEQEKREQFFRNVFEAPLLEELEGLGQLYKWTAYVCREALKESGYMGNCDVLRRAGMVMGTLSMPVKENVDIMNSFLKHDLQMQICDLLEDQGFVMNLPKSNDNVDKAGAFTDTEPPVAVARILSLGGPVLSFNSACATPLYAIKLASVYLEANRADIMIAGSHCSNEIVAGNCGLFDILGVLCNEGESRPFDRNSKGLIAGSGAGAFVLKRLEDAVRDNDTILAVIESVGWSNDGGGKSILAPDPAGQLLSYEDAYRDGVSDQIDYIECHATGTRAGDQAELDSLSGFFKPRGVKPLIGALKGNTGHFFTASANAAIAKVILAMRNGIIPATVRVNEALKSSDGYFSGDDMVLENMPWPMKGGKKRGGVNAFGFGGINAHLVLSEYRPEEDLETGIKEREPAGEGIKSKELPSVAIVGMGIHIGPIDSVNKFFRVLLKGKPVRQTPDTYRWRDIQQNSRQLEALGLCEMPEGAYINSFPFDFIKYKFAPKENTYLLRRDMLLLNVAEQALKDAGIRPGDCKNTCVIINCSQDFSDLHFMASEEIKEDIISSIRQSCPNLNERQVLEVFRIVREGEMEKENTNSVTGIIPNVRVNRISAHWKFKGPSFMLMERENSIARALELSQFLLGEGAVDCAVIGSVELSGELEHIFMQKELGRLQHLNEWGIGEGAAVLVLKRKDKAQSEGNRIYALMEGVALSGGASGAGADGQNVQARIEEYMLQALEQAKIGQKELGYLELPHALYPGEKEKALRLYSQKHAQLLDAVQTGSVEQVLGCCFSLTAAAGVIKNALQLYYKVKFPSDNAASLKPWMCLGDKRASAVGSFTSNGNCSQIVLTDYREGIGDKEGKPAHTSTVMVAVAGECEKELEESLKSLEKEASGNKSLKRISRDSIRLLEKRDTLKRALTIALVCESKESLLEEIHMAVEGMKKAFSSNKPWQSRRGSYFTPQPSGRDKKVVWMCPPGRMVSPDRVFDILLMYPDLKYILGQSLEADPENRQRYMEFEDKIRDSSFEEYFVEFSITKMTMELVRTKAGILPDMLIGASMGEIASMYASDSLDYGEGKEGRVQGVLSKLDKYAEFVNDKNIFERYFGHKVECWENWYVVQPVEDVRAAVEDEAMVFISIIGSPTDVIISGEREACRRVLGRLGGYRMQLDGSSHIHTPVSGLYYDELYNMERAGGMHIKQGLPFTLYSTCFKAPMENTNEAFSRNIAGILTETVDFAGVLNTAYDDGGRIFINLGTNELCTKWAENTLDKNDVLILSLHGSQGLFEDNWYRFLSKIVSHNLAVSTDKLCMSEDAGIDERPGFIRPVSTGLPHHRDNVAKYENRQRVKALEEKQLPLHKSVPLHEAAPLHPAAPAAAREEVAYTQAYGGIKGLCMQAMSQNVQAFVQYQQNQDMLMQYVKTLAHSEFARKLKGSGSTSFALRMEQKRPCIWDYDEVIEMTCGSMSKVLGNEYAEVDSYPVRGRMPAPPFLFVTRITAIKAELGCYKPSMIEMEYDIDKSCIFAIGERVSSVMFTESAQIGIFLVSYIGIDISSKGSLRYRIADTKTVFHDYLPGVGDTIRGVFEINSFIKSGDTTLVSATYKCYHGDRLFLSMDAMGGFFTTQDLENSKGLITKPQTAASAETSRQKRFTPYAVCSKSSFEKEDMESFYNGRFDICFGSQEFSLPRSKRYFISPYARMVDRIKEINFTGGSCGLGEVWAEKELLPEHWAFDAHFKNDPVFPGSLMLDAVNQCLFFFAAYSGVLSQYPSMNIGSIKDSSMKTVFRGQVERAVSMLRFHISIKEIVRQPQLCFYVDANVFWGDKNVLRTENISLTIE